MKEVVVDTHALVWWQTKPRKLGRAAARVLRMVDVGRARAWVPSVVAIELALLNEAGRRVPGAAELEAATRRNAEVRVLAHDLKQASDFVLLRCLGDPFDRMVVAAARVLGCSLVSADETIASSGLVSVIWD